MSRLLGVWHPHERIDRWAASASRAAGTPALVAGEMTLAGARRCGGVLAAIDGVLFGDQDPLAALAATWLAAGDDALAGMRGEAALVLWDPARRRGVLARDQLGVGCLYLRRLDDGLAFASDLAGLLKLTGAAEPDEDAVACWLAHAALPAGATLFAGITRLPPGHAMLLDGADHALRRFWNPDPRHRADLRGAALEEAVRAALVTAVHRRVPGDGTAATLLSGGLDSTAVASMAAHGRATLASYSALFPGRPGQDESDWIRLTAQHLGLRASGLEVRGGSVVSGALEWAERRRLPLPAPNWFYQRELLARMREDGVSVALDGEGGDELFGADRYLVADVLRAGHPLRAVGLVRRVPGAGDGPGARAILRFLARYGVRGALSAARHERLRRPRAAGPSLLAPWAAGRAAALLDPWRWREPGMARWWSHLIFTLTETVDSLGARDYFRAKGALSGVRIAQPFYDVDLVELMLSVDPRTAFDPHLSRPVLRRSMRGWAPEPILRRAGKSRFESLFVACFAGPDAPVVMELLGDPSARIRHWTRPGFLGQGPAAHPGGVHRWTDEAFRLVTTEIWLRSLEDPAFPERLRASTPLAPLSAAFRAVG